MIDPYGPVHLFNALTTILTLGVSLVTLALVLRRENREKRAKVDRQVEEYHEFLSDVFPSGAIGQSGSDMSDATVRFPRSSKVFVCRDAGSGEIPRVADLAGNQPY